MEEKERNDEAFGSSPPSAVGVAVVPHTYSPNKSYHVEVTHKDKDSVTIALYVAKPVVFDEMVSVLIRRDFEALKIFKKKYKRTQPNVITCFQKLAYVMEFCRSSCLTTMSVVDAADEQHSTEICLDLSRFIASPKACCRPKTERSTVCPQVGMIRCSRCLVACWCSDTCLGASFETHQHACNIAFNYRNQLGL
ncbi:hypothetical protein QOT17_004851 [Balamuthia mandrillaris]